MHFDFVVIGHQRSGSTYFTHVLSSNPAVLCLQELFNPVRVGIYSEEFRDRIGYSHEDIDKRDNDPEAFYEAIRREAGKKLLGFKLFREHQPYAIEYGMTADIPRIFLRRNYLASYSSFKIAEKTNIWHRYVEHDVDEQRGKIAFDFWDFDLWVSQMEAFYDQFPAGKSLNVEYERIGEPATLRAVADFLGVAPVFDTGPTVMNRVLSTDIKARFEDFSAVEAALKGTPHEKYLA